MSVTLFLHPASHPLHPRDTLGVRGRGPELDSQRLRSDLVRWVSRRVQGADLEDVVQETLAEALRSHAFAGLRSEEDVRRFVFAIARQRVADWFRRRHRERRVVTSADEGTGSGISGGVVPPAAGSRDLLRWAHHALPGAPDAPRTFEWLLREGEGETLAEIARSEGVAPLVVRQRVSRLRRLLRRRWAAELALFALVVVVAGGVIAARSGGAVAVGPDPSGVPGAAGILLDPTGPRAAQATEPSTAPPSTAAPKPTVAPPPHPSSSAKPPSSPAPALPHPPTSSRTSDSSRSAPSGPSDASDPWGSTRSPPQGTPAFNRGAAAGALSAVNVATCASPASNTPGHVTVTFAESGKVTSAVVDSGAFSPDERQCLESLYGQVKVPAFTGSPVKVGKSFVLRAASPKADSCDPPYEVDAQGRRKFKVACLKHEWGF